MFPSDIGKNCAQINSRIVASVAVVTSTWETCIFRRIYLRKQRYRAVRLLVKANNCKNLYQLRLKLDIGIMRFTISFIEKDVQFVTLIIIVN